MKVLYVYRISVAMAMDWSLDTETFREALISEALGDAKRNGVEVLGLFDTQIRIELGVGSGSADNEIQFVVTFSR